LKDIEKQNDALHDDALNVFHIRTTRHDQDRLEINIGFDGLINENKGHFNFDIDFLLFVPKSLGLNEIDPIDILRNEFQSYFRLHSFTGLYSKEYTASILFKRLHDLDLNLNEEAVKTFAIEFDAYLKGQKRKLHKITKKIERPGSEAKFYIDSLSDMQTVLAQFRLLLDKNRVYESTSSEINSDLKRELFLLNEYISHLYVQVLLRLKNLIQFSDNEKELSKTISDMVKAEAEVRERYDLFINKVEENFTESAKQDFYLRRISLLKKYFSKPLFVKYQEKHLESRMLLPVYGISAAFAASFAIMVQLYTVQSPLESVGINTVAFISIGVIAYVIKDIMKDTFRRFFFRNSRKFFPDIENKLFIKVDDIKKQLGFSKDFVKSYGSKELNPKIAAERYKGEIGAIEKILGEDVLHYKKRVSLNLNYLSGQEQFPWGFREIIRYRFDRLRVSMEDAYKRLPLVGKDGNIVLREGRRIYKVHLVVQVKSTGRDTDNIKDRVKAYEINLDKNGLVSCEGISWNVEFGHPGKQEE